MRYLLILLGALITVPLQAQEWSIASELSYLKETGNTDKELIGLKNDIVYRMRKIDLNGKFNYTSDRNKEELQSEEYLVEEKLDWKFQKAEYAFQLFRWEKDIFRNLEYRLTAGLGMGFNLLSHWKDVKDTLVLELGGQQSWEYQVNNKSNQFNSLRNYLSYRHYLSDPMYIEAKSEYIYEFNQTEGYRLNIGISLVSKINSHFSLRTAHEVRYDQNPIGNIRKKDTRTRISLIMDIK